MGTAAVAVTGWAAGVVVDPVTGAPRTGVGPDEAALGALEASKVEGSVGAAVEATFLSVAAGGAAASAPVVAAAAAGATEGGALSVEAGAEAPVEALFSVVASLAEAGTGAAAAAVVVAGAGA